jgi:hypothetical protein
MFTAYIFMLNYARPFIIYGDKRVHLYVNYGTNIENPYFKQWKLKFNGNIVRASFSG